MYLTGITDEAAPDLETQIRACRHLGWQFIDLRTLDGRNITSFSRDEFQVVLDSLHDAGLQISSFCSGIANWSRRITDSPEQDYAELERAIPLMRAAGTRFIRVMSYQPGDDHSSRETEKEVILRLRELTRRAEDAGVILLHENCDTWGGLSVSHTMRLLEEIESPSFRLVFDTGNPFNTLDHGLLDHGPSPARTYQNTYEFYKRVRPYIEYVHIKDGRIKNDDPVYTFPGEGEGSIPEILADLRATGYDGAISIEPHMAVVFHDPSVQANPEDRWNVFVEYGKRTASLLLNAGYSLPDSITGKLTGPGAGQK